MRSTGMQRPQKSLHGSAPAAAGWRISAAAALAATRRQHSVAAAATSGNGASGPRPASTTSNDDRINLPDYEHAVDPEAFRSMGYRVVDWIADYYKSTLETAPVKPPVRPGYLRPLLPDAAPETAESFDDVMADFEAKIMPGVMHWQSPSFFAWYPSATSFPAILGEMLIGALNMIGFSWQSSPVATELEMVVMDWLADLCGLPNKFKFSRATANSSSSGNDNASVIAPEDMAGATPDAIAAATGPGGGAIQGTSSEAVLVAMLAARARTMRGRPPADARRLVAYASDQTHSCYKKACMILGLEHVRAIPTSGASDWALRASDLEAAIAADEAAGLIPFFVCATVGTTSSCAVDPLEEIGAICTKHSLWFHIDSAYAGCALVCPEHRPLFAGIEAADSFQFNPHKWMLTTFDCCAFWIADAGALKEALSLTPIYLQTPANGLDYKDWQVPLGRRFRALKLWMVLRMYGAESIRALVRHHLSMASWLANQVAADTRFEIAAPPRLGLVCFRLSEADNATNRELLERVNATGEAFLVGTELDGRFCLRMAVGCHQTQPRHVQAAWDLVRREAAALLQPAGAAAATARPRAL